MAGKNRIQTAWKRGREGQEGRAIWKILAYNNVIKLGTILWS